MLGTVIQVDGWDPVAGAAVALRAASHDDAAVCHLDGATWWPAISNLPTLRYDLFDGDFGGQITAPASSMTLRTEPWPEFARYSLADARFRLWTGEVGASWSEWTLRFDGRLTSRPAIRDGAAELAFAVDDRWLDTPLLATYAGTGGIEGPEALKGTAKPLALGAPRYVPGILVDAITTIFQVSAYGAIVAVDEALEKLAGFGLPVADHSSFAALEAAEIPRGRFATCRARGLVRFGAPTEGTTCFQVRGDMAGPDGWARRPGRLIRRLAQLAGGLDRVSDSSLAALDVARPYDLSIYLDQQTTAREMIQRLAASVNAVAGVSWLGKLFVLPVAIGASSLTLAADGSALPPVASVEELEIAAPWKRLAIGAERAWTVHQLSDVAFTAPLTERGAYAADTIYREGDIVSLPDGSRWLRQAAVPSAGIDPVEGATWTLLTGKVLPKWEDIADPDGTKPTNNADVTADNVSKDTAAVGGKPAAEIVDDLAAARGALRLLDEVTLPAIRSSVLGADQRISDARIALDGRIDGTRDEIATERRRAIGAEEVLNERISNVIADGTGYDDAAIYARVGEVDRARADGDRALGERISTVQSAYSKGVTANGDFRDGLAGWNSAGWTVVSNAGGTGKMLRSAVGGAVQLTPVATAKIDLARSYRLHARFRIMGSVQSNYVGLQLFDAAGTHLGNVYTDVDTVLLQPGSYNYSQLYEGVNPGLVPPFFTRGGKFSSNTAFAQPLMLANYADSGGPFPNGYVELESFWLEDVGEARIVNARVTQEAATLAAATKAVADRTDVTEAQMRGDRDSALLGRIRSTETAVTDGRFADASRVTSVEARLDAVPGAINARVETAEQASVGRDAALADRATTLEASASGSAATENANPDFSAWPPGEANPRGWVPWASGGNSTRSAESLGKGGYVMDRVADALDSGVCVPGVYLTGGWYVVSARVWRLSGGWAGAGVTWGGVGGSGLDFMRDRDNSGLIGDADRGGVREWTKLVYIDPQWVAYRAFHAMDNWAGLGFGAVPKSLRWLYCGIRKASDAEVKAQAADATLNAPGGAMARLGSAEATIADLPNRYAAASRVETLEAQVNFAADSGLQRTINARIEDRSTAIADAKAGAVAETVRTLRGEYDGTKVAVTQHSAVIADKLGAGTAVFRFAAEAGSSVADVTGIAGAGAPSVLRFRANTIIFDGQAIFNDSVGLGKLARAEYGSYASYYAALDNGYTPPLGQTYLIIDPAQAPLGRIGAGGSVLIEVEVNIVTNAGTRTVTYHPDGRQMITDILADGGVSVGVGNIGKGFGTNGLNRYVYNEPNPGQTPYDGRISAYVSRGSVNQPYALDGEFYYRQVSADYTVYSLRVTGKWTFI